MSRTNRPSRIPRASTSRRCERAIRNWEPSAINCDDALDIAIALWSQTDAPSRADSSDDWASTEVMASRFVRH